MQFSDLNINSSILKSLANQGYTTPTPIQQQAIPHILAGHDILGVAQTGTGKTAAFSIPIIQKLSEQPQQNNGTRNQIKALILTPTRELAIQIEENIKAYSSETQLRHTVIYGGVKAPKQIARLKAGVDILIATPGRLLDLLGQGYVNIKNLQFFVLDEADRMLDMGFIGDIRKVLKIIPEQRQTLFFSATMPSEIVKLSADMLKNPKRVSVTPPSSTVDIIAQQVYFVDKGNKNSLLLEILQNPDIETALVFTRTKYGADKLTKFLNKHEIKTEAIHGDKAQNARQRALENFKNLRTRILVATDIAARGIDVDNLAFVFNYEIPNMAETYVHRIGRTGRAGAKGTAISFCDGEEIPHLVSIEKLINKKIPVLESKTFPFSGKVETAAPSSARTQKEKPKRNNPRYRGRGQSKKTAGATR
ncbi:MAG: DEAD/DEAH box helicase [Luteibaculaceae bacterium]